MTGTTNPFEARARAILRDAPLIDGHNDLAYALREKVGLRTSGVDLREPQPDLNTDIPRLRLGGVGGQFWSVWVPAELPEWDAVPQSLEQMDVVHGFIERYPETFALATTADEVEASFAKGRVASLLGLEGGSMIGSSLPALRNAYARGVRYMTLTHWLTTRWADAATDAPRHGGLTAFGREVVREMNRLGMLVDLSHVSPATMAAALDVTEAPAIFSHSGALEVCDHPRNVPDEILRRVAANGGVVMAVFLSAFVSQALRDHRLGAANLDDDEAGGPSARQRWLAEHPGPTATLSQVADHIVHLRDVAGIDHVGIGSDFDGGEPLPEGLGDVSRFPALLGELLRRGYSDDDVRKVAGGNVLRALRGAETVAARLKTERPASEATIEELDGVE
ncbi:MAG: rane dipeptidase [Chloroflexota bacterium]|jgi:membrane dipeptidase|nr:rane dipeptidase [Chloroflexota bacterium]